MKVTHLLSAAVLLFLAGCQKAINIHGGFSPCRITRLDVVYKINNPALDSFRSSMTISYNAAGNPVNMITTREPTLHGGDLNYNFRYDKENRLTDFIISQSVNPLDALVWYRYSYPRHHLIVDSEYAYEGKITDPAPPINSFEFRTELTLDDQGRIVRDSLTVPPAPLAPADVFVYDSRGDLVRPEVTYDDWINPYRTNNVWMLIYMDYSLHNPSTAVYSDFNAFGLPQDVTAPDGQGVLFETLFQHLIIHYSCSCTPPDPKAL